MSARTPAEVKELGDQVRTMLYEDEKLCDTTYRQLNRLLNEVWRKGEVIVDYREAEIVLLKIKKKLEQALTGYSFLPTVQFNPTTNSNEHARQELERLIELFIDNIGRDISSKEVIRATWELIEKENPLLTRVKFISAATEVALVHLMRKFPDNGYTEEQNLLEYLSTNEGYRELRDLTFGVLLDPEQREAIVRKLMTGLARRKSTSPTT